MMHESDQLVFRSLLRRVSAFMFFSTRHIMSYHPTGITQHWRWALGRQVCRSTSVNKGRFLRIASWLITDVQTGKVFLA